VGGRWSVVRAPTWAGSPLRRRRPRCCWPAPPRPPRRRCARRCASWSRIQLSVL